MSKDFFTARRELKEALIKQQDELEEQEKVLEKHRRSIEFYSKMHSKLTLESSKSTGDILDYFVLQETLQVQAVEQKIRSIQKNIRDIKRDLKLRYSLALW